MPFKERPDEYDKLEEQIARLIRYGASREPAEELCKTLKTVFSDLRIAQWSVEEQIAAAKRVCETITGKPLEDGHSFAGALFFIGFRVARLTKIVAAAREVLDNFQGEWHLDDCNRLYGGVLQVEPCADGQGVFLWDGPSSSRIRGAEVSPNDEDRALSADGPATGGGRRLDCMGPRPFGRRHRISRGSLSSPGATIFEGLKPWSDDD